MGGVNSTRTITLVDDEKAGVIQLSDGLVHRLQDQFEKDAGSKGSGSDKSSQKEEKPHPPPRQPPPPPPVESKPIPKAIPADPPRPQHPQAPPPTSWMAYSGDSQLMAAKLREEKHNELRAKDQQWRKRIQDREAEYVKTNQLREEQIAASAKEVESFFIKVSQEPVCQNEQDTVLKCYRNNGKQPLRCAQEVDAMTRCADLSRIKGGV